MPATTRTTSEKPVGLSIGDTYIRPGDDYWTAGINVGEHGNRIVAYGRPEEEAARLRDLVLDTLLASGRFN
jgi:hypothetical protein